MTIFSHLFSSLIWIIISFFLFKKLKEKPTLHFNITFSKKILILILFYFIISIFEFYYSKFFEIDNGQHEIYNYVKINFLVSILVFGIIGPISEELLFRCILFLKFKEKYNEKISIIFCTFIWSILHFGIHPIGYIYLIFYGLIYSYSYINSKSLFWPIAIHSTNNISILLYV
jgi:membrane protease YdiL (CAAX protease family)